MFKFAAYWFIRAHFVVVKIVAVLDVWVLMNIHVLPITPLKKEFFVANITLFVFSLGVGFQVCLVLPALTEVIVTKLTTKLFWVVQINMRFPFDLVHKRFSTFITFK